MMMLMTKTISVNAKISNNVKIHAKVISGLVASLA